MTLDKTRQMFVICTIVAVNEAKKNCPSNAYCIFAQGFENTFSTCFFEDEWLELLAEFVNGLLIKSLSFNQ